jgi:hypothetical protein
MDWTPRHRTTNRTETLLQRLSDVAREVDDGLLEAASPEARGEWSVLRQRWPSAAEVRSGVVGLSDDELDAMIGKVLRFRTILARLKTRPALSAHGASLGLSAAA